MAIEATTVTSSVVMSMPGPCRTGQRWWIVDKYESRQADSHSLGTSDGGGGDGGPSSAIAAKAPSIDCKAARAVDMICCPADQDVVEATCGTDDGTPVKMPSLPMLGSLPEVSVVGGKTRAELESGGGTESERGMGEPWPGDFRTRLLGGDDPVTPPAAASPRLYLQATPRFAHGEHLAPPSHFVSLARHVSQALPCCESGIAASPQWMPVWRRSRSLHTALALG